MAAAGYLSVLSASACAPVGFTLIKIAHVRELNGRPSLYMLYIGRLLVVLVFPVLVGLAYLYGKRNLVPISHASGVVWHTALSWLFLPEGKRYGAQAILGMLVFTSGVLVIVFSVPTDVEDDGDWNRLVAWLVTSQVLGCVFTGLSRRAIVWWFALFGMLKTTEIMVSAGAWNLVSNNYETGWNLVFVFAPSLLASGISGVVITDNLISVMDMCRVMPVLAAIYCVTGVLGDMVFYARWAHLSALQLSGMWGGVALVVGGIVLLRV